MSNPIFSAKEPSLGYLYQIQYALFLLLNVEEDVNAKILIEALDDIELQVDENIELYQSKYHLKRTGNLTDRSSDFWKTIRVWCEQISDNTVNIDNTIFTLVTTENILNNSVMYDIKSKKDVDDIVEKLNEIAKEVKKNATNKKGYLAFKALSTTQQKKLIEKIYIVDSSLNFEDIQKKIKNILRYSAEPLKLNALVERIEGWFLNNSILHLQGKKEFIGSDELGQQIHLIVDSFKQDNLPMDFPNKIILTEEELENIKSFRFIKQLHLINLSSRMETTAISDYYRAFQQRSKWLRENLLNPEEEIVYDKKLIDEWDRKFGALLDDTEDISDEEKVVQGKKFYRNFYIDNVPRVFIRERFQETYLILGSCHMLSDRLKIGWHPDFEEILKVKK
jgi:hypothetical protein